MGSADQAADIVKYFLHNPLRIKGQLLEFSLSAVCSFLQGYVEMASVQEASKLVEHYSTNSLKLKGKTIHVSFSAEYQTLGDKDDEELSSSSNKRRRSLSPQQRSHSSRKDSPSPKRRSSAEKSRSRRRSSSRKRDKRQCSKERSRRSSRSHSRKSPSKDQSKQTDESAENNTEDKKDQPDTRCDDSDLEGVAVIADDCDELNSEDEEFIEIDHEDDQDSLAALTDQEVSEDMQYLEESDDNTVPNTDMPSESDPNATTQELQQNQDSLNDKNVGSLDKSTECKEANELQQNQEAPKDKTVDNLDGSGECKEAHELQQNQEEQKDKTVDNLDRSNECNKAKELQQNQEAPTDKTMETTDGSSEFKEAQSFSKKTKLSTFQMHQMSVRKPKSKTKKYKRTKSVESLTISSECEEAKELQQTQQHTTAKTSDGSSDYKEAQKLQQNQELQKDTSVPMKQEASDFPVNLENCITLDEFTEEMTEQDDKQKISTSSTEEKYGRVLEVKGFPLAKKYTEADLLNIGRKCGEVAGCCLVRNNRKVEKALIEMVNAADASKLEAESKRQNFKLGGKILKITVSDKYSQVKERISVESDSGKAEEEKHGEVKTEEVSQPVTSCEEMHAGTVSSEQGEEAQKETSMDTLMQTSSNEELTSGENENNESKTQNDSDQLSSQTSQNVKESLEDNEDVNSKEDEKQVSASDDGTETLIGNSDSVSEMPTPERSRTEFVRPVVGYFCSLCDAIYASEEEAKDGHCRTVSHHQKLKERMEQKRFNINQPKSELLDKSAEEMASFSSLTL